MLTMTPEVLRACSYPISEAASGEKLTSYMTFPSLVVSTKRAEIRCKVYKPFNPALFLDKTDTRDFVPT